ncbi:MAG: EAL domain-containing protein [Pseudomonadota bacterium]|nr:EAL domain-containing protein [Pseudomonadota bacterium]
MSVIAEGVETAEQMGILQKLNCHRFQGYHFSKPLPLQLISEKLRISSSIQA